MEELRNTYSEAETAELFATGDSEVVLEAPQQPKRKKRGLKHVENLIGWVYISPMIIGILVFTAIPLIMSIMAMFYDWIPTKMLWDSKFVGMQNFKDIFGGLEAEYYWEAIGNTFIFVIQLPIGLILGMFLALAMNRDMRGVQAFRVIYYLPGVMSVVAVSIIWQKLFDSSETGTINTFLMKMGASHIEFMNNKGWITFVVTLLLVWKGVGYTTLMFIAGLQSVSTDQLEAARIDGANAWVILIKITMPALYPIIFYLFVTGLMGALQMFNEPYILLGNRAWFMETAVGFVYRQFNDGFLGLASVGAWVLAIFIFIVTAIQMYVDKKKQEAE